MDLHSSFGITRVNKDRNLNVCINNSLVDSVLVAQPLILPSMWSVRSGFA